MSKGEVLYVKGMNVSESDHEEEEEVDMWDDKKLNDAYDKAVIIANAEIAKRIAMSTNNRCGTSYSKGKASVQGSESKKKSQTKVPQSVKKESDIHWKVGMPCRAIYDGDGVEYEAFLLRMINDKECVVRFLGYENSEIVSINTLKPSLGNRQRASQIQDALNDTERRQSHNDKNATRMDYESDWGLSGSIPDKSHKKKKSKKKIDHKIVFPPNTPHLSQMNYGLLDHQIPPPPLTLSSSTKSNAEDQAIHSMLLSWYMTGYYTGLYQGMKNSKKPGDDN